MLPVLGGDVPNFDDDSVRVFFSFFCKTHVYLISNSSLSPIICITFKFNRTLQDSLYAISILDGVDPAVVEALQYIIDCVVDEEESELDASRRFAEALDTVQPTGDVVVFRLVMKSYFSIIKIFCSVQEF